MTVALPPQLRALLQEEVVSGAEPDADAVIALALSRRQERDDLAKRPRRHATP